MNRSELPQLIDVDQLLGSGAISGPYRKTRPLRLTLLRRLLAALNCLR